MAQLGHGTGLKPLLAGMAAGPGTLLSDRVALGSQLRVPCDLSHLGAMPAAVLLMAVGPGEELGCGAPPPQHAAVVVEDNGSGS